VRKINPQTPCCTSILIRVRLICLLPNLINPLLQHSLMGTAIRQSTWTMKTMKKTTKVSLSDIHLSVSFLLEVLRVQVRIPAHIFHFARIQPSLSVSRTCTAPFDRLKIFLITRSHDLGGVPMAGSKTGVGGVKIIASAVSRIYSEGGILAFWTGNGLSVAKIFPESAIKFFAYESAASLIHRIASSRSLTFRCAFRVSETHLCQVLGSCR
jgi:hypothetical protein